MHKATIFLISSVLGFLPLRATASEHTAPIGFEAAVVLYGASGAPTAIKLAPHIAITQAECQSELDKVTPLLTAEGLQVEGVCIPIPPAPPSKEATPMPKNPDRLNPETFQQTAKV